MIDYMIFDSIFFTDLSQETYPLTVKDEKSLAGFILGYIINDVKAAVPNFFYPDSFLKNGGRFCLALHSSILENESADYLIEHLGSIFFSLRYFKLNDYPVINILLPPGPESNNSVNNQLEILRTIFSHLGYEMFYYCFINGHLVVKSNLPAKVSIYNGNKSVDAIDHYSKWYFHFLEDRADSHVVLLIFNLPAMSFYDIYLEMKSREHEFKKNNPQRFSLLEEGAKLKRQLEKYEITVQGLKKDLESKQEYVANLHIPESTMKKVVDFYYYEYEILPLWYKRFGHIIKVLMGKRTFRSLFNDDVKKYKD